MRWYWFDRYIEFQSGVKAKSVKCICLSEDHLHDHYLHYPFQPNSLIIEGIAQTAGLLCCEHYNYTQKVVFAKINKAIFYDIAVAGDTLIYSVNLDRLDIDGTSVSATCHRKSLTGGEDQLFGEFQFILANLNSQFADATLFSLSDYRNIMISFDVYKIGVESDGVTPLKEPECFLNL